MTKDTYFPTKVTIKDPGGWDNKLSLTISQGGTPAATSKTTSLPMLAEISRPSASLQSRQQHTIPPCTKKNPDDFRFVSSGIKAYFSNTCIEDLQETKDIVNIITPIVIQACPECAPDAKFISNVFNVYASLLKYWNDNKCNHEGVFLQSWPPIWFIIPTPTCN